MADLYNLASHYWGGDKISLHASQVDGDIFATFPIPFIRSNGTNTWDYVMDVANMLVDRKLSQLSVLLNTEGEEVDLAAAPSPGHYIYRHQGATEGITYAAGPYYKNRSKTATTVHSTSSAASSQTPSTHSNAFRTALLRRDFDCVITGDDELDCEAAHLVPKVYRTLLDIPLLARAPIYDVSSGILLSRNLHHRYDRLEWSFYYKAGVYYVHFFVTSQHSIHHGKAIPISAFRVKFANQLPNAKLCAWHYAQCARAHIRGFPIVEPLGA